MPKLNSTQTRANAIRARTKKEARQILDELVNTLEISKEEIGLKLGVSSMTIYRWLKKEHSPSYTELKALKQLLSLSKNKLQKTENES